MDILSEVQEYELKLKRVEDSMKKSKTKFIEAHGTTLEVLKVSNEIEISDERFSKKERGNINVYSVQCGLTDGS